MKSELFELFVFPALIAAIGVTLFSQPASGPAREYASRAREILQSGIESKDPDVRVQTIIAISMIGRNERVIKRLETALQDKSSDVRSAAIRALSDLKAAESARALENTLEHDPVPDVSFSAARALYALHNPAGKAPYSTFSKRK